MEETIDFLTADEIYTKMDDLSISAKNELARRGMKRGLQSEEILEIIGQCSVKTLNEIAEKEIVGSMITLSQFLDLCSGEDESGLPHAFASLLVDTVDLKEPTKEPVSYRKAFFSEAVFSCYASGGGECIVIVADFLPQEQDICTEAEKLLQEWFLSDAPDRILSFILTPTSMEDSISLLLHDIVFAQAFPSEDGPRLVMAFNGLDARDIVRTGLKLSDLKKEMDAEFYRRRKEEQAALAEVEDAKKELEEALAEYRRTFGEEFSFSDHDPQ